MERLLDDAQTPRRREMECLVEDAPTPRRRVMECLDDAHKTGRECQWWIDDALAAGSISEKDRVRVETLTADSRCDDDADEG